MALINRYKYKHANFGLGTALGVGAGLGAIGGIGYNAYRLSQVDPKVQKQYDDTLYGFGKATDNYFKKNGPSYSGVINTNTPEGKAFIQSGSDFDDALNARNEAANLHGGRAIGNIALGTAAGAGLGASALALLRMRGR